jgi:predicted DNA-binding transcriptional regulator YafY
VAALLVLQARGRVTAEALAAELEISVRTARRDLEALASAGLPVYAQPGRGGGWSLLGGARTDLSGLTAAEARALFLLAGPVASVAPEARAALRKLVRALPETFRAEAEAAASAVVLDTTRWGGAVPPSQPHVDSLQGAVIERRQVRLGYADRRRHESTRIVHPLGLVRKGSAWYLVAGRWPWSSGTAAAFEPSSACPPPSSDRCASDGAPTSPSSTRPGTAPS